MTLEHARIAFIGAGNMASALIHGLIRRGIKASHIRVADINENALTALSDAWPVKTFTNNHDAIADADVVVLAVKPQVLPDIVADMATTLTQTQPLIISIAAGISMQTLGGLVGDSAALVRCMPNTPAMVEKGATGLYANAHVSDTQRTIAHELLQAVGITHWVDSEAQIDAITALSGSGPAYFFYLMEAMIQAGEALGLDATLVKDFTLQTALGAAELAIMSDDSPATLRKKVTSPGGTTAAALEVFDNNGMSETIVNALHAARDRAKALS